MRVSAHEGHSLRAGSERRLRAIQRAFRAVHSRLWRFNSWRVPWWRRRKLEYWLRQWLIPTASGVALGLAGVTFFDLSDRFESRELALRHMLSGASCDAARAQGLAPALRGRPGYYEHHDRDGDGIACEPSRSINTPASSAG